MSKKVKLQLVGLDGNAFSLMGAFQRQAKEEGWSKEEIDEVLKDAMSGDYNHLLCVLLDHCEDQWDSDEDDQESFNNEVDEP